MMETLPEFASIVLQTGDSGTPFIEAGTAAALAVGLAALASGYAQRGIGAAAMGAVAEDGDNFIPGLILTAVPETLIIIAFVTIFVA